MIGKNEEFLTHTHPLLHPASISEYYNRKLAHFFLILFFQDSLHRIEFTVKFLKLETKSLDKTSHLG